MVKRFADFSTKSNRPYAPSGVPPRVVAFAPPPPPKDPHAEFVEKLQAAIKEEEKKRSPKGMSKGKLLGLGFAEAPASPDLKNYNDVLKMLLAKK